MKYINWSALMCAVCGICLGALFMGIYEDRQITKIETSLYEQTQQTHQWMQRYQQACDERDVLSDCIRAFHDEQECEEYGDPIYSVCHDIMPAINRDTTDLGNWSYCY